MQNAFDDLLMAGADSNGVCRNEMKLPKYDEHEATLCEDLAGA